ncbi:MAG: T9SS type A sorting domain-containing protein [Burkholderiales bacterium]|nr:T9SS type A sorting domain-containing protein [Bacteroidia bacterium]
MRFKIKIFIFLVVLNLVAFSQVKIGQWVDHLSYNYANSVVKAGGIVYASNGSGLSKYDESDNSLEKLTKINGLSDVGIKLLRKNDYNNDVLVIYNNTNIDVIKPDGKIINISDVKRKIIQGKKYINEVYFKDNFAYISCGFGIILFDTDKLEIKDTYYLGNGIATMEVYQVTRNDTAVFAATPTGIYYGKTNTNLSNYQNWRPLSAGIAPGPYNSIVNFNGKIIVNYSEKLKSNTSLKDTLYELTNAGWMKYSINGNYINSENIKLYDYSKYNKLLIIDQYGVAEYNSSGSRLNYLTDYGYNDNLYAKINDLYYENNNLYWVADQNHGLIKSGGAPWTPNERLKLNGPSHNVVNDLDIKDGKLVVAPVDLGVVFNAQYQKYRANIYENGEWRSLQNEFPDSIRDVNAVSIDPNNKEHIAFACMASGLVDFKNNQIQGVYKYGNSPLVGINGGSDIRITGVSFDKNSNIWASITLGKKCIAVKKTNNLWTLLDFEQFVVQPTISKIIFDKYDQAWIVLPRNVGLMIYKDVNGLSQPNSSNTRFLSTGQGNGKLPSVDVRSICADKDGKIWVGTAKGIAVFYNPENVFTNSNWDSQQILIEQDGHVQILLENDVITAIAVDGVNRKWIGTESSGVYCFSSDGQEEIYHFTEESSPIYSNIIKDIATDETTGDVFFATDKGIQSFRTPIIKGFDDFTKVHAFPNPIRPGSSTPVYITGLIDEADVKITDVNGNLIWSTKSQGGQVVWNLQSFSGTKAASGVYMIYCSSANGDKSATAKLLIIN